jgi:ubiquitin-protein ligase
MDLQYFISLHEILLEKNSFSIKTITLNKITIDYIQFIINYEFDDLKINLSFEPDDIISHHIFRLLKTNKILNLNDNNYIDMNEQICTEFILYIGEILLFNNKNYCTVCGNKLNLKGLEKISHCGNIQCINQYYNLVTDNRIMDLYNQDSHVFMFLLEVFVSGLSHPKVEQTFKPLPFIPNITDIAELKKIIPDELQIKNHSKLANKFNLSCDDLELYMKLDPGSYCIIKNAISNNYFSMSSKENIVPNSSEIIIHINYSAQIENKFQQNYFLFHGSSIYSWYPIIKNGLKVMSGTGLQANGAAYGNGIYFSDSFQFSLGYSNRSINYNNQSDLKSSVVGVFEILEEPSKYKKAPNIFVIDNDTILLLRSLIVTKQNIKISNDITNYFIKDLPLQKKINKFGVNCVKNKRLESEYKKLSSKTFILDIKIIDNTTWYIEFINIKNNFVKIELIFSNYPISPPIIKLLSNHFINGLINEDNTIIIDLINPAKWKLTNNLTDICLLLYNCFNNSL